MTNQKMLNRNITTYSSNNQPLRLLRLYRQCRLTELLETLARRGLKPKEQLKVLRDLRKLEGGVA